MHFVQRPCYKQGSLCPDLADNRTTWRPPDHLQKRRLKWYGHVFCLFHQIWPKPSCKAQWKEEEDKADRRRGGKTASGNGQAWSSPSPWRKSGLTVHKEIFTQTKDPMTRSVLKAKTDYLNAQVAESQTESNCSLLQTLCLLNPKSIIFLQIFQLLSFHILSVSF